jgi:hypothetical protein
MSKREANSQKAAAIMRGLEKWNESIAKHGKCLKCVEADAST